MRRRACIAAIIATATICSRLYAVELKELHEKAYYLPPRECEVYIASLPDRQDALYARGLARLKAHRDNEAEADFSEILKRDPGNIRGLWGLAELCRRNSEYSRGLEFLGRVFGKEKTFVPALVTDGYIRLAIGDAHQALKSALRVEKLYRADEPVDRPNLARALILIAGAKAMLAQRSAFLGKFQAFSIKGYIQRAAALNPDAPEVLCALGDFYLLAPGFLGGARPDAAIRQFKMALRADEKHVSAFVRLARAYRRKNDMVNFRACMGKVRELDPRNLLAEELAYLQ